MFRLRDLVGLAIILGVLIVPEEGLPPWVRIALAVLAIVIVAEVAWEVLRRGRRGDPTADGGRTDRRRH